MTTMSSTSSQRPDFAARNGSGTKIELRIADVSTSPLDGEVIIPIVGRRGVEGTATNAVSHWSLKI